MTIYQVLEYEKGASSVHDIIRGYYTDFDFAMYLAKSLKRNAPHYEYEVRHITVDESYSNLDN